MRYFLDRHSEIKRALAVVPANAGTHNHRLEFVALRRDGFLSNNKYHAYGSLRSHGRQTRLPFEMYESLVIA